MYLLGFLLLSFQVQAQTPIVQIVPSGPIVCAGTKLDAVTGNMTGPFTYLWSNGATSASVVITQSGFYRVTVGGFNTNGVAVSVRSAWTPFLVIPGTNAAIQANGPLNLCPGQTVQLTATGGQFFSSYQWNTGATTRTITANATGDYTVTVTNAFGSCTTGSSATVHVEAYDAGFEPTIHVNGPTTVCKPGYVHLSADPGFSSYSWSTGATTQNISVLMNGSQAGAVLDTMNVYLTVAVNNNCEFTTSTPTLLRSIREPKLRPEYCDNFALTTADSVRSELVLTYMTQAPQYDFEFENTNNPGVLWNYTSNNRWCPLSAVTPALQPMNFYNVRVRPIIGGTPYCYGSVCQIGIVPPAANGNGFNATALRVDGSAIEANVFPNPSATSFKLVLNNLENGATAQVSIYDLSGRNIDSFQYDSNSSAVEFGENLTNGIYFVTVAQGEAKSVTRIVKTN